MTRKTLAKASGVSERYLAQLEAGEGNISVLLLRKVAHAMSVPVETLVREDASDQKPIALLGLRGAGKSTLGARLAESLQVPFVELDREVKRAAARRLGARREPLGIVVRAGRAGDCSRQRADLVRPEA